MFAVINLLWARLRPNLARTTRRGLKWALEIAQEYWKDVKDITNFDRFGGQTKVLDAILPIFLLFFTGE